jgi:exonuclease III
MAAHMNHFVEEDPMMDLSYHVNKYIYEKDIESNPFDLASIDSKYYDVCDILPKSLQNASFQYKVLHLNIRGLSSKFDELKLLLSQLYDIHVILDVILLCETFINDNNADLFNIPGYKFIYQNRQTLTKGGVAMYIRDNINFKLRKDLCIFHEGEFETLFIETVSKESSAIIGEIYRIPNTNVQQSLERYESILNKLVNNDKQVIIGTDQNFDYLKIDSDQTTSDLLDAHLAANVIPTITKPTRVTHSSATLIDNLYVRHTNIIHTGIICCNISDHFPIFSFVGQKISVSKCNEPLRFKYRPLHGTCLKHIVAKLKETDWHYLSNMETTQAYTEFINHLNNIIDSYAPENTVVIQPQFIIREKWMTKGLLKSSSTANKLYRKCAKKKQQTQRI